MNAQHHLQGIMNDKKMALYNPKEEVKGAERHYMNQEESLLMVLDLACW